jgi:hypothetical protein
MSRHHGKTGTILLSTTGSGTPAATVSLSGWTLDLSTDKVDVTCFGDANKVFVQGLKDVKGSFTGIWDDTFDALFTAADSADGVNIILYPDITNSPTKYWRGPGWLDASVDASNTDAVKVKGDFVARGSWTRNS